MKCDALLPSLTALLLVGCIYESPLTKEHNIPIDSKVLGLWEWIPDEKEDPNEYVRMMVLKYSATEYLINYPIGKDGIYCRGYPIEIGDVPCVQLELIGTAEGSIDEDEERLFYVVSYRLINSQLEVKTLNTDLVSEDLKTSEALVNTFLKHKDNKDLFNTPGLFKKIKD